VPSNESLSSNDAFSDGQQYEEEITQQQHEQSKMSQAKQKLSQEWLEEFKWLTYRNNIAQCKVFSRHEKLADKKI
jgi:hypothetical protein